MKIEFDFDETFEAPPQRVFEALTDFESMPDWMPNLESIEVLTDGEIGEGTRWREKRMMFGKEATETMEFTGFDPPGAFEIRADGSEGSSGSGKYRFGYTIEPEGEGTHVRVDAEITEVGFVMGIIGKLFTGMFKKPMKKDLTKLKEHLES